MQTQDAADLMAAASDGRRVLVVSASQEGSQAALQLLMQHGADVEQVRFSRGAELVTFGTGGRVYFASIRSKRERGLAVDRVFFDDDVDPTAELLDRYAPCIAGTRDGVIAAAARKISA